MQYTDFNWKGECFLVADDDHFSHLLLDKVLKRTGAIVLHAYSGTEAIELLTEKNNISIALIDMIMPGNNGYEVIEKTKRICPNVSFFAYTADIFRVDRKKCQELGFLRCFAKPMLPAKLFAEISNAIPVRNKL